MCQVLQTSEILPKVYSLSDLYHLLFSMSHAVPDCRQ